MTPAIRTCSSIGLLSEIYDPPKSLRVLGNTELLTRRCFSIVGSRKASAYGIAVAHFFAKTLSSLGYVIVSGLAKGIDTAAHEGALSGGRHTIAVLGSGLRRIYPRENLGLSERIVACGGAVISEYGDETGPMPFHFPQRNRIISGLSVGVLVVEAHAKSGSLITARTALDQGRDVFVVPGKISDVSFSGSHELIQMGATLVTKVEDIVGEVVIPSSGGEFPDWFQFGQEHTLEELFAASRLPYPELLQLLRNGISKGLVVETGPQTFLRVSSSDRML